MGCTGCGKSTFCNLITGKDPRKDNTLFKAKASAHAVTNDIKIESNLTWWDGKGKLTLIDVPGLQDTKGRDQLIIDNMVKNLKNLPKIDAFILMLTGDRLGN